MTALLIIIAILALSYMMVKINNSSESNSRTNALTGETFNPPTKESERFSTFFMVKVESEKEIQEFISICKAHDIMLHMAISSPVFWDTLLRGKLYGKIIYPVYFSIENDKWGLRDGYASYYTKLIDDNGSKKLYDKFGGSIDAFRKVIQPEKTFNPKTQFYAQTDKIWESESLHYGSFDKIPQKRKNEIFNQMNEIANVVGYKEFKVEKYLNKKRKNYKSLTILKDKKVSVIP